MGFGRQLIAFGGMVMLGSILLPKGEALAFGQQWRPAPGFAPAQAGSFNRIAKMPSFRPQTVARPAMYPRHSQSQQRPPRQLRYQGASYPPRFAAWQGYPARPGAAAPYPGGFFPQPGSFAAGYPGAGWGTPFAPMAQPWGHQPPMFARQFAWRPAGQPWLAQAPTAQRPQYRARMAPKMAGYGRSGSAYTLPAGNWRPVVRPAPAIRPYYAYQRYVARPPVYAPVQRPMFRIARPAAYHAPGVRVAGLNPVQAAGRGYWRPQARVPAGSWNSSRPFRPQAYGRSLAVKQPPASRDNEAQGFNRDNLPGWVTTYQDSGYEDSCTWCGGS